MSFYLLICPHCKRLHIYEYNNSKTRIRKHCNFCNSKFEITPKRIIEEFESFHDCREAHKILSKYHNDHLPKGSYDNIIETFRKVLLEQVSASEKNYEKINGHRASPHDQMTIHDLSRLIVEQDRVHWTCVFPAILYHRLSADSPATADFSPIVFKRDYGTVKVYSSGLVEGNNDFSTELHVSELEGVLANFKTISGHDGHLLFKIHDHEYTIKINNEDSLAQALTSKFNKPKCAFLQQQFKVYYSKKDEWRNEAYNISDLITGMNNVYNEKLSQEGINVLVFGEESGDTQLLQLNNKVDEVLDSQTALSESTRLLQQQTTFLKEEMRNELELTREHQRAETLRVLEGQNKIEHRIEELLYSFKESRFNIKCRTIIDLLTEQSLSAAELAQKLGQKRQGVKRYLEELKKKNLITFEIILTGKRGRPRKEYKIKGIDENE